MDERRLSCLGRRIRQVRRGCRSRSRKTSNSLTTRSPGSRDQRDSMKAFEVEIEPGIWLGQKLIPVANVGCYIPGGKYPLISAAIMSIGTARAAGVGHVVACAPPRDADGIFPPQLYALHTAGADEIYVLGGVQRSPPAYGCVGMPAVDMVTGPEIPMSRKQSGNCSVSLDRSARRSHRDLCHRRRDSDPALVATDLLGQAEHGPDSPVWLITTSEGLGCEVIDEVRVAALQFPTARWRGRPGTTTAKWSLSGR